MRRRSTSLDIRSTREATGVCVAFVVERAKMHRFWEGIENIVVKKPDWLTDRSTPIIMSILKIKMLFSWRVCPYNVRLSLPQTVGGVFIERLADYLLVKSVFGFSLAWDGGSGVYLKMSEEHLGGPCGLCGNFNHLASDDLTTARGKTSLTDPPIHLSLLSAPTHLNYYYYYTLNTGSGQYRSGGSRRTEWNDRGELIGWIWMAGRSKNSSSDDQKCELLYPYLFCAESCSVERRWAGTKGIKVERERLGLSNDNRHGTFTNTILLHFLQMVN